MNENQSELAKRWFSMFKQLQSRDNSIKISDNDILEEIKKHGKKHLDGLSAEQIAAGQKLKFGDPMRIPRLTFFLNKTVHDAVKDFILFNVSKAKEE